MSETDAPQLRQACSACGAVSPVDAQYCSMCGGSLSSGLARPVATDPARERLTRERMALVGIAVAIVAVVAWQAIYGGSGGLRVEKMDEVAATTSKNLAQVRTCFANQRTIEGAVQQYLASGSPLTVRDRVLVDVSTENEAGEAEMLRPPSGAWLAEPRSIEVRDLVPAYLKAPPYCPTTGRGYVLDGAVVELCSQHGHY